MIETKYDKTGDIAVVTMANPPADIFTMELGAGLEGAVRRTVSEDARALVLQADGPLFCGGADAHIFAGTTAGQAREMFAEGFQLINTLEDAPFPVIVAVHGMCFAVGGPARGSPGLDPAAGRGPGPRTRRDQAAATVRTRPQLLAGGRISPRRRA
jgi:hypothetical protein